MEKRVVTFFCIFLVLVANIKVSAQAISDKEFFQALNMNYRGLQEVKTCVENNNYTSAKKEFVAYLKRRQSPTWLFDWKDKGKSKPTVSILEADKYANNELVSVGTWHKFGSTINWKLNPTENNYNEWTWQLNRHYFWIPLGAAYWRTNNEKYAKAFVFQLNSWLKQCKKPNDNGNYAGSAWRTLEAGLRMRYTWPNAFYYFLRSPSFDDESVFRMVKSIYEHATFLYDYRISNQRLSHEMNGLYTVGALFPEFRDAEKWRNIAAEKLYAEEVEQFYPDGAQKELAPGYHGTNLDCIVSVYELARLNHYPLPDGYVSRLENIYEYYQKLVMPDGKLPAINDSRWAECTDALSKASKYFANRADFAYSASRGVKGKKPKYTSVWMPWAGIYIMRSGWDKDAFYALFEVGPYGTAHQHEDKLSFILSAYGSRLITECGSYAYDNSQWRKYATSARGHNVARVDGMDQNRSAWRNEKSITVSSTPLNNRFVSTSKYDLGEGFYTEGYGDKCNIKVIHHRTLKFVKNNYWVLSDEFIPSDGIEHSYDIWFHLNTDKYIIDKKNNVVYSNNVSEANIAIIRIGEEHDFDVIVGQQTPEIQGWVSETVSGDGFSIRPVATPVFHRRGSGLVKEFYIFIPFRKSENFRIKEVKKINSHKYRIYFDKREMITIRL